MPIDMGDEMSREYARMKIGNNGKPMHYPLSAIGGGLPDHWTFDPDETGKGQHIYVDGLSGMETTVHPSRFYDEASTHPTELPPGWDRRLDTWGSLFFIDRNTKLAVREDPRFNSKVNQETGLPNGWNSVMDHKNVSFFYTKVGILILGTYDSAGMKDRSMAGKYMLTSIPVDNEDPTLLIRQGRPMEKRRAAEKQRLAASAGRAMTIEEKDQYYSLFEEAPKQNAHFITHAEAVEHCKSFHIPQRKAIELLIAADTDRDQKLDVNDYANALHQIRLELEKTIQSFPAPAMTADLESGYHKEFTQCKKARKHFMTLDEVLEYSQRYDLPNGVIMAKWTEADANKNGHYSPNEFANGLHEVFLELGRRRSGSLEWSSLLYAC